MYELTEAGYQETPRSRACPILTSAALTEFLAQSETIGQSAARAAFRQQLSAH